MQDTAKSDSAVGKPPRSQTLRYRQAVQRSQSTHTGSQSHKLCSPQVTLKGTHKQDPFIIERAISGGVDSYKYESSGRRYM